MSDLTGLPVLDVAIGLALLFFLLATVVASVNELIQTMLNARARVLTRGLKSLLDDDKQAQTFLEQWRIERLAKPPGRIRNALSWLPMVAARRGASYIPARTFALTVIETVTSDTGPTIGKKLYAEAQKNVDALGVAAFSAATARGLSDVQKQVQATRVELERAFDEVMDRASGWYKRYVQVWVVVLSLVVAVGLNVNTFTVAEQLWKDDALRSAVVQQAEKAVGAGESAQAPEEVTPATVAEQIDGIEELKLPVGWTKGDDVGSFWGALAGWIVTAAAVALGAPFWFDVLGKAARVRGSGNREGTAKSTAPPRPPDDRDDPAG